MTRAFLQVAIPVLYVYDEEEVPPQPPGFDMGMLPVVSRVLKDHAGTDKVTVITGAPAPVTAMESAFTHLALQYANLQKASPEAGHLLAAEFIADNFDAEKVVEHLKRLVEERQRELVEQVEDITSRRRARQIEGVDLPEDVLGAETGTESAEESDAAGAEDPEAAAGNEAAPEDENEDSSTDAKDAEKGTDEDAKE